jgi:RNA polymerase sigma-70 factor, ECF subfamily
MNERDSLDEIKRGSHSAFATLFNAHYAALVALAERMLQDRAVAEELVQEVFLELWRRRESISIQESLRAYLFRATRNRGLNHLRHLRVGRDAQRLLPDRSSSPAEGPAHVIENEIEAAVREAVEGLPKRCREVFELSRVHGLKYTEIADAMSISVKGVEAQMGRALRILRGRLAPWLTESEGVRPR